MRAIFSYLFIGFFFFFLSPVSILAENQFYKTKFDVVHTLSPNNSIETTLNIGLTNTRADTYVTQFTITFPPSLKFSDLVASSPKSPVAIGKSIKDDQTIVTFSFSEPIAGTQIDNLLEVTFKQDNLLEIKGTAYELVLPTFGTVEQPSRVTFNTSALIDKKLSISKPRPDVNQKTLYTWNDAKTSIVYLVFGEFQTYNLKLRYYLTNNRFVPVKQDIAFPPETLLQEIFVKSISPKPDEIFLDTDGNYIGRYVLAPQEKKVINFRGFAKVYAVDQEDMVPYIRNQFAKQQPYLLNEKKYWEIKDQDLLKKIEAHDSVDKLYSFTVDTLDYSFARLNGAKDRLGADGAFKTPTKAVCMEYTDMFIGMSRSKSIYSREIQGFGYSRDDRLRPLSLKTDILHAWPEYYDTRRELWIPIDPTWDDTSGIDYLNGFDLNHIVFAIHGSDSVYPLPAGMYKKGESKDVDVTVTEVIPDKNQEIIVIPSFDQNLFRGETKTGNIKVKNTGNVFIKNVPVILSSGSLKISTPIKTIYLLSPGQSMTIPVTYQTKADTKKSAQVVIDIGTLYTNTVTINVTNRLSFQINQTVTFMAVIVIFIIIVALFVRRI